jgi:hypothetical protein
MAPERQWFLKDFHQHKQVMTLWVLSVLPPIDSEVSKVWMVEAIEFGLFHPPSFWMTFVGQTWYLEPFTLPAILLGSLWV